MGRTLILAAPQGPTRDRLKCFLEARGPEVISLARESIVAEQRTAIEDYRVRVDGRDILEGAAAAIILDSGVMWPIPMLDPTPEIWEAYHGRFDEYLRNERESASFWYSLLDIINERVPCCVNPQTAFALEAEKPEALAYLAQAGVPVAPTIASNDPQAIADFATAHPGTLFCQRLYANAPRNQRISPNPPGSQPPQTVALRDGGLHPSAQGEWLSRSSLSELPLERFPVLVQAFQTPEFVSVQAIDGRAVVVVSPGGDPQPTQRGPGANALVSALPELRRIQTLLHMEWAHIVFGRSPEGWQLSDFSPAPSLEGLSTAACETVLEALWSRLEAFMGAI